MFAPHHELAAAEAVRGVRPGGRLTLLSWTPEGAVGQMFAAMEPFAPPPPAGAQPAPRWGDEGQVAGLLADRGPTIAVHRDIADDPDRTRRLDDALVVLARVCWPGSWPVR
ncbi:hypothetical protein [Kineococcus sp. SYSU DK003]|uniref:hypothetical protein n=1 Tax=Kineococcus sp. SYSU DK003 TaxID=3383124 RepID=UPI003D7EA31B